MGLVADQTPSAPSGGYDEGYSACACFWGQTPGTLVQALELELGDFSDLRVLDAGCGEGKNAVYLALRGARVDAFDISPTAIANGMRAFGEVRSVNFGVGDIRTTQLAPNNYDIVIAYGLLHCLPDEHQIRAVIRKLQRAVVPNGYVLLCAFNDRITDLRAHPGFRPTFLPHDVYLELFRDWDLLVSSDQNLWESHPHNQVPHVHAMTRLLAQKTL